MDYTAERGTCPPSTFSEIFMTQTPEKNKLKVISGLIPADQRRILAMTRQGLRPAQIAYALGLRIGGTAAVQDVLIAYGIPLDPQYGRRAS